MSEPRAGATTAAEGATAALDRVRACLSAHAEGATPPDLPRCDPPELDRLARAFGLTPFERDVLLLAAGPELDPAFPALCARAGGDPRRPFPTFGLALAALPGAHWSALLPSSPLRRWRLVQLDADDGLTTGRLRLAERVLHQLANETDLDDSLRGLLIPLAPAGELAPSHRALAERAARVWPAGSAPASWPVIQLLGPDPTEAEAIAAALCARLGLWPFAARAADLAAVPPAERPGLAAVCDREAVLSGAAILIDAHPHLDPEAAGAVLALVDRVQGPVLIAAREPLRGGRRAVARFEVARPSRAEQAGLWRAALGPRAATLDDALDELTAQFRLPAAAIREAAALPGENDNIAALWEACRVLARPKLEDLAQRIETAADWPDLVLPGPVEDLIRQIAAQVRHRPTVHDAWGFAARGSRGLGIACLFAGPSGTGKTLAAEVLANALRLDLYRVDLSQTVSKYIGETERNLARVFEAAEGGGAVLLFDEADALFGKRGEVKDSRDRYANLEVSYLLQRMETYQGLAILTTNLKDALDEAFLRRLRFVIDFPFPDAGQRAAIWRRAFPPAAPTEGLDPARLARLAVSGGHIRNIALGAAFLAAEAGTPVRMAHVLQAAHAEFAKLDRRLGEAELGGWA